MSVEVVFGMHSTPCGCVIYSRHKDFLCLPISPHFILESVISLIQL